MKFLCLGYLDMERFDAAPEPEKSEIMAKCMEQVKEFRASGTILEEDGLEHMRDARSIRPKNGVPTVTNGPFVETPAQLGAFFVVEAADIDEAVRVASKHPGAMFGEQYGFGIEVRPIQ